MLGFATLTELGIAAGVFQMFAHGLITAVLFMMCGVIQHKAGTRNIPRLGGLAAKMPIAADVHDDRLHGLARASWPGRLRGRVLACSPPRSTRSDWLLLMPIISVAITAAYYIWAMQRTLFGPLTKEIDTGAPARCLLVRGAPRWRVLIGLDRAVRYVARADLGLSSRRRSRS